MDMANTSDDLVVSQNIFAAFGFETAMLANRA